MALLPALLEFDSDSDDEVRFTASRSSDTDTLPAEEPNRVNTWITRVSKQGPWDQQRTPEMLRGAPSLPMPVTIAQPETLAAVFKHLERDDLDFSAASKSFTSDNDHPFSAGEEPFYGVPMVEYEKGVIYADRRLDLCKMVVGPLNINALMDSLEQNQFIQHFLLGNNIIGPAGARRITKFIQHHPDRMDTWYLAGNCIDAANLKNLVSALCGSVASNVWLKRNPLGPNSVDDLAKLILESKYLRTLDLDQTELSDPGVARLFTLLCESDRKPILENLYLNSVGIGISACQSIATYLSSRNCTITSLYLSINPIGDEGAEALARGLLDNTTLERLTLSSVGLTSLGASSLLQALKFHPSVVALDLGQSYQTEDLHGRFNYFDDDLTTSLASFLTEISQLRYLNLGTTAMTPEALVKIYIAILQAESDSHVDNGNGQGKEIETEHVTNLCHFSVNVLSPLPSPQPSKIELQSYRLSRRLKKQVSQHITQNVLRLYSPHIKSYDEFNAAEKRWLLGDETDVRKIDSVYRNRDAGAARRGLVRLDKWWKEDNEAVLDQVMSE